MPISTSSSSPSPSSSLSFSLPDELVGLIFVWLDPLTLAQCGGVCKQWKEIHGSDDYWRALYESWFSDSLRMNEANGWMWNFRFRDEMLARLPHMLTQLMQANREQRMESVQFLRTHCQLLRFMIPATHHQGQSQSQSQSQTSSSVSQTLHAAARSSTTSATAASPIHSPTSTPIPMALPVSQSEQPPSDLPLATPIDANQHSGEAVNAGPRTLPAGADATDVALASMYSNPPPVPPSCKRRSRRPLPRFSTNTSIEYKHAVNIIKDALVNLGWRTLMQHTHSQANSTTRSSAHTAEWRTSDAAFEAETAALEHATSVFPFHSRAEQPGGIERWRHDASDSHDAPADSTAHSGTSMPHPSTSHSSDQLSSSTSHSSCLLEYGAVLVAWTESPWLRFDVVSAQLDVIAQRVQSALQRKQQERQESMRQQGMEHDDGTPPPLDLDSKLTTLTNVLYNQLGFRGNEQHYYDARNSFIHCVLHQRTGIPISLAIIVMAVCRRIGVQCVGINSPGHFLIRAEEAAERDGSTLNQQPGQSRFSFINAFSGVIMNPAATIDFIAHLTPLPNEVIALSHYNPVHVARTLPQLQPCSPASLFIRMYRNLLNLYQMPASLRSSRNHMSPAPTLMRYEMESYLHHCASQVVELVRLSGDSGSENRPELPAFRMFVDRFRYATNINPNNNNSNGSNGTAVSKS